MAAGTPTSKAGLRFDLRSDPDMKALSFTLSRYAADLDDLSQLFGEFSGVFTKQMAQQFGSQGSWGSGGWKQLRPTYRAWKLAHGYPGVIGVRTGALKAAMTGGSGYRFEATKSTASYGVAGGPSADYGRYFDAVRPVIRFPKSAATEWGKTAQKWMVKRARESGWGTT